MTSPKAQDRFMRWLEEEIESATDDVSGGAHG